MLFFFFEWLPIKNETVKLIGSMVNASTGSGLYVFLKFDKTLIMDCQLWIIWAIFVPSLR